MKRRQLIKNSVLWGTGASLPLYLPATIFGANAPSSYRSFGCIGTGRMGSGDMKNLLSDGLKYIAVVVAVCDVDLNRAKIAAQKVNKFYKETLKKENWNCSIFQDHREMLTLDLDGVTISTPDHNHAIPAIDSANRGCDIYLQKPLTYSIDEGQDLVKAVRRNKVILQTGSQQRSSGKFRLACQAVRNGLIGKLKKVEVTLSSDKGTAAGAPTPPPANLNYDMWMGPTAETPYIESCVHPQGSTDSRPGWLQIEKYCRGMITGWGAHMYDIAQWGLDQDDSGPVSVDARGEFPKRGYFNVHTKYKGTAEYSNGLVLESHTGSSGVKFHGEDGWIYVSRRSLNAHDRNIFKENVSNPLPTFKGGHMANFLDACQKRIDPVCPVEVGHRSNSVCVMHHISMKLQRKLKWDPVNEHFLGDDEANAMLGYSHRSPYNYKS
ncbi:MAG: Gfo/Idh/MocA family oxidoreductase [Planctomycetes bacterium]|nr:Gfo/Idh/MocA family oxidoreductase [Planctomycetota bacterium]